MCSGAAAVERPREKTMHVLWPCLVGFVSFPFTPPKHAFVVQLRVAPEDDRCAVLRARQRNCPEDSLESSQTAVKRYRSDMSRQND